MEAVLVYVRPGFYGEPFLPVCFPIAAACEPLPQKIAAQRPAANRVPKGTARLSMWQGIASRMS
jgi:hypothetical protein